MARTFDDNFPIAGGNPFYASQLNQLRAAINERATAASAVVTLPDTMTDDTPIALDTEDFHTWLDKARTAIETILAESFFNGFDNVAVTWPAWTKATLLGYVHSAFVTTAFVTSRRDRTALTVAGDTQTGTLSAVPATAGTVTVKYGTAAGTAVRMIDDGVGGWTNDGGEQEPTAGSIDYNTGEWTITTAEAVGADIVIDVGWTYAAGNEDWAPYEVSTNGAVNEFYCCYPNEIFYALVCMEYSNSDAVITDNVITIPAADYGCGEVIFPWLSAGGGGSVTATGTWISDFQVMGPAPLAVLSRYGQAIGAGGGAVNLTRNGDGQPFDPPAAPQAQQRWAFGYTLAYYAPW